jgi:ABC-type multidrug transport system fused ATPase/permease subunit
MLKFLKVSKNKIIVFILLLLFLLITQCKTKQPFIYNNPPVVIDSSFIIDSLIKIEGYSNLLNIKLFDEHNRRLYQIDSLIEVYEDSLIKVSMYQKEDGVQIKTVYKDRLVYIRTCNADSFIAVINRLARERNENGAKLAKLQQEYNTLEVKLKQIDKNNKNNIFWLIGIIIVLAIIAAIIMFVFMLKR